MRVLFGLAILIAFPFFSLNFTLENTARTMYFYRRKNWLKRTWWKLIECMYGELKIHINVAMTILHTYSISFHSMCHIVFHCDIILNTAHSRLGNQHSMPWPLFYLMPIYLLIALVKRAFTGYSDRYFSANIFQSLKSIIFLIVLYHFIFLIKNHFTFIYLITFLLLLFSGASRYHFMDSHFFRFVLGY